MSRGRPRGNLLTSLKIIPSQPKRKRGKPRKQIHKVELPEVYAQKGAKQNLNQIPTLILITQIT